MPNDSLSFLDRHEPALESGRYEVTLTQSIQGAAFRATASFSVAGPRFHVDPADVQSMFPPPGSLGDHALILPHIVLNRSTLPWERTAIAGKAVPWLALLLFDETETIETRVQPLGDVVGALGADFALDADAGELPSDRVTTIRISAALAAQTLPNDAQELALLAHVRQAANGDELAVVVGNRLPRPGASSVVHLVSVEERYTDAGFTSSPDVVLVSLATWRFACPPDGPRFKDLLLALNGYVPKGEGATGAPGQAYDLRLPGDSPVPLRHHLRNGQRTLSRYRGPLGVGPSTPPRNEVLHADELLTQDPATKMLDVSYAAAWELGRLLTLANKHVAAQLFLWKRRCAQAQRLAQREPPFRTGDVIAPPDMTAVVRDWFDSLRLVKPVPFAYLVPDERLLPPESIRFFEVDLAWVAQLYAGAFSIGHVAGTRSRAPGAGPPTPAGRLTGFVFRSSVVTGWPQLLIDGWDSAGAPLVNARRDLLAPGLLLCLFEGDLARVDFHTKPESLHYGFTEENGTIVKFPRDASGAQMRDSIDVPIDAKRRIAFAKWNASFVQSSAAFALAMIEGVDRVRFLRNG